ncbi:sister chromatid cohesion 1 protein 2 isoform X2 [Raphanus sativus]|uniref:Sister chromatid cohesion 1 protein 2 isoform X2 n=1 Tax=Raphanus sativus TaxID=3726 RepID=A0A6J0NJR7_RAPSA|nr:sister chromatid cohesion 1 protein 2 isoform X2 [Raphanus sativus]XP_056862923.1 sister chromatid cohesion 1 protein 2 isoform X2 [Raphanus sativus]
MFYSQQCVVPRKGPLGAIWVAAYFYKKLKKAQVKDTHIPSSVDQILQKELDTLAYRVLAYLLLGVVRIYSKKVDFLFHDCNRALVGVKEFVAKEKNRENNTNVPLPAASTGFFSIALPECFELDAFDLGVLDDFHGGNVKPQEDITLKEDGGSGRDTESMDQYYNERFDMEEDLLSTFHETFVADHSDTRHESSAHDMDIDAENDRYASGETSVRVVEAEPLNSNKSSRDPQAASRYEEDPESDVMLVEPQVSEEATARETICNIVQRLEDPESDDMLGKLEASEDIRRAQEEETICTVVQRLEDPHEPPGDNPHRDGHMENSESEKTSVETSREKTPHDGSLPSECKSPEEIQGSEDQPSGAASRIVREKEIPEMSTREEPEPGSVSENKDLPEGIEKHRGHNDEEMTDTDMFHGSHKEPSETPEVNQVRHSVTEKGFLSDKTFSEEWSEGSNAKDTPVAVTPKPASWLNISEGETSHQFSIIPTPAGKESSRVVSRKRKCLIDDEVMIPSKVMKKMIEDPSTLVAKRRRVPYTDYPEKRIKRFIDPSRSSWDPLIPYGSLDLQLLFCQPIKLKEQNTTETPKAAKTTGRMKRSSLRTVGGRGDVSSSEQTENGREIMETPQTATLTELRITVPETVENNTEVSAETEASSVAAGSAHPTNFPPETPAKAAGPAQLAPETPARTSEQTGIAPETPVVSEQVEIAPETPVRESMSKRYFNDHETFEQETRPGNSFTSFEEHPSEICEDRRDLDAILMNEEQVNAQDETEDLQQETWSARTRNVAKFLEKTFLEQREKGEEEKASLLELCRGRTQKESARLFYETLVLKTKGYLEVKQDHPYSDILLSRFSRQQEAC